MKPRSIAGPSGIASVLLTRKRPPSSRGACQPLSSKKAQSMITRFSCCRSTTEKFQRQPRKPNFPAANGGPRISIGRMGFQYGNPILLFLLPAGFPRRHHHAIPPASIPDASTSITCPSVMGPRGQVLLVIVRPPNSRFFCPAPATGLQGVGLRSAHSHLLFLIVIPAPQSAAALADDGTPGKFAVSGNLNKIQLRHRMTCAGAPVCPTISALRGIVALLGGQARPYVFYNTEKVELVVVAWRFYYLKIGT